MTMVNIVKGRRQLMSETPEPTPRMTRLATTIVMTGGMSRGTTHEMASARVHKQDANERATYRPPYTCLPSPVCR